MKTAVVAFATSGLMLCVAACNGSGGVDEVESQPSRRSLNGSGTGGAGNTRALDGAWSPINDSPIDVLTISGDKVTTTGRLACPGIISGVGSGHPVITMNCAAGTHSERKRGTVTVLDATSLAIDWEGPAWGGIVDSLRRTSEVPR